MNEPEPRIDGRTFQDLVDAAKRMIPSLCPEWTNWGPTDPGIALIEVFAWMTEQVIQELDAVPERAYEEFLRLIGFEPFPPKEASAEIHFWLSQALEQPAEIPAGTTVGTVTTSESDGVDFQTDRSVEIRPAALVTVATADASGVINERLDFLRLETERLTVFEPLEAGSSLLLGFSRSCANHLLHLEIGAHVEGIGVDPTNPPIVWEASTSDCWLAVGVEGIDRTGGLNRDGHLVIEMPAEHDEIDVGGQRAFWLRVRLQPSDAGQPAYRSSPVLNTLEVSTVGGIVPASHSSPMEREFLGTADGSPGLTFRTSRSPVLPPSVDEHVIVSDHWDGETRWERVADFSESGPMDAHYTFSCNTGAVRFGPRVRQPDGSVVQHGRVPPVGSQISISSYRIGGGEAGNVGAGTITVLRDALPFVARVSNPRPAHGGADAETVENAKRRAPLWLQTGDRAVTAADLERIALWSHPRVARARCLDQEDHAVRLLIVPHGSARLAPTVDDLSLDAELGEQIGRMVEERRLLGTRIEMSTPRYVGISVIARVQSSPQRSAAGVEEDCLDALRRLLHPIHGGAREHGWPFGQDVNAFAIAPSLSAVEGVDRVDEILLFRADARDGVRLGTALERVALPPDGLPLLTKPQVVVV